MTPSDISGYFLAIRAISDEVFGEGLLDKERQVIRTLVEASLRLGEGALLDLNRAADALEGINGVLSHMLERQLGR